MASSFAGPPVGERRCDLCAHVFTADDEYHRNPLTGHFRCRRCYAGNGCLKPPKGRLPLDPAAQCYECGRHGCNVGAYLCNKCAKPDEVSGPLIWRTALTCSACSRVLDDADFSMSQLKAGKKRRCTECVASKRFGEHGRHQGGAVAAAAYNMDDVDDDEDDDDGFLRCSSCEQSLPEKSFGFNQKTKGDRRRCKACVGKGPQHGGTAGAAASAAALAPSPASSSASAAPSMAVAAGDASLSASSVSSSSATAAVAAPPAASSSKSKPPHEPPRGGSGTAASATRRGAASSSSSSSSSSLAQSLGADVYATDFSGGPSASELARVRGSGGGGGRGGGRGGGGRRNRRGRYADEYDSEDDIDIYNDDDDDDYYYDDYHQSMGRRGRGGHNRQNRRRQLEQLPGYVAYPEMYGYGFQVDDGITFSDLMLAAMERGMSTSSSGGGGRRGGGGGGLSLGLRSTMGDFLASVVEEAVVAAAASEGLRRSESSSSSYRPWEDDGTPAEDKKKKKKSKKGKKGEADDDEKAAAAAEALEQPPYGRHPDLELLKRQLYQTECSICLGLLTLRHLSPANLSSLAAEDIGELLSLEAAYELQKQRDKEGAGEGVGVPAAGAGKSVPAPAATDDEDEDDEFVGKGLSSTSCNHLFHSLCLRRFVRFKEEQRKEAAATSSQPLLGGLLPAFPTLGAAAAVSSPSSRNKLPHHCPFCRSEMADGGFPALGSTPSGSRTGTGGSGNGGGSPSVRWGAIAGSSAPSSSSSGGSSAAAAPSAASAANANSASYRSYRAPGAFSGSRFSAASPDFIPSFLAPEGASTADAYVPAAAAPSLVPSQVRSSAHASGSHSHGHSHGHSHAHGAGAGRGKRGGRGGHGASSHAAEEEQHGASASGGAAARGSGGSGRGGGRGGHGGNGSSSSASASSSSSDIY